MKLNKPQEYILYITFEAKDDLKHIFNNTFNHCGEVQWKKYSSEIDASLILLKKNPDIGFKRSDIPDTCKSYPVLQHIIVYKIIDETIYIIRVLHKKMNFNYQF